MTTEEVLGSYDTEVQAKKAAWAEMRNNGKFDDWGEEYYKQEGGEGKVSSFFSCMGENFDEDYDTMIYLVSPATQQAKHDKVMLCCTFLERLAFAFPSLI